jgi:hypothetical protein
MWRRIGVPWVVRGVTKEGRKQDGGRREDGGWRRDKGWRRDEGGWREEGGGRRERKEKRRRTFGGLRRLPQGEGIFSSRGKTPNSSMVGSKLQKFFDHDLDSG